MSDYTPGQNFAAGQVLADTDLDNEFNAIATMSATKADKDGTLQTNLDADSVDGFDAADNGGLGTIPICSGTMQTGLNAEKVGGLTASDLNASAFNTGTALIFYQASAPSGWTKVANPSVDRVIGIGSAGGGGTIHGASSWAYSNYTVTVAAHTLTSDEIPPVSLSGATVAYFGSAGGTVGLVTAGTGNGASLTNASIIGGTTGGGGGSHTHTGSTASRPSSYRPPILLCIIATKD